MEDFELEKEAIADTQILEPETQEKIRFEDLPSWDALLKSEKEVATPKQDLKGLESVKADVNVENETFARKKDEKKSIVRRKVKLVSAVYMAVVALLFVFLCANAVTLIALSKDISKNTDTINYEQKEIAYKIENAEQAITPTDELFITLNEPRDYDDDKQKLSFLDKMTILFKNIFG